ncbi:MAG: hypothetical protein ACJAZO_003334 [Myxococcota bacterium]|jgi:hypothetical protein
MTLDAGESGLDPVFAARLGTFEGKSIEVDVSQ